VDSIEYDGNDMDEIDIEWYFHMDEVGSMEDINYVDVTGQVGEV